MRVSRELSLAADTQLSEMRKGLKQLLNHQRHIAGELMTTLYKLDEKIAAEQERRAGEETDAGEESESDEVAPSHSVT